LPRDADDEQGRYELSGQDLPEAPVDAVRLVPPLLLHRQRGCRERPLGLGTDSDEPLPVRLADRNHQKLLLHADQIGEVLTEAETVEVDGVGFEFAVHVTHT